MHSMHRLQFLLRQRIAPSLAPAPPFVNNPVSLCVGRPPVSSLFSSSAPVSTSSSPPPPLKPPIVTTSSSATVSMNPSDGLHGMSAADTEKHVADLQREIRSLYTIEKYDIALELVAELHDICTKFYGPDHPVSASAINNHALLNKSVGKFPEAVELFTEAIQSYEGSVGQAHSSTATALHNLGLTYKAMYESNEYSGVDKLNLQDRAEEALTESISRRESRMDPYAATTMYVLAAVKGAQGFGDEAGVLFKESISLLRETYNNAQNHTNATRLATGLNNYGFWLKSVVEAELAEDREAEDNTDAGGISQNYSKMEHALNLYTEAFDLRKEALGEAHVSTIVSMQNIAELLHLQGRTEEATFLQKKIIELADNA